MRSLTALPVFNEVQYVDAVLDQVTRFSSAVLVVDDGSTDGTADLLDARKDILQIRHPHNCGYGAALHSAFRFAQQQRYDVLVTIDCDGQHEPQRIPEFVRKCDRFDIVSGSRYLEDFADDSAPPEARWRINQQITHALNQRLGLSLTDAFCGFKAYRVEALRNLDLSEPGYAMPLELWVQAVAAGLRIVELPVPRIYLDESRSFGGSLDDAQTRLRHYYQVIERSMRAFEIGDQNVQQPLYAASF